MGRRIGYKEEGEGSIPLSIIFLPFFELMKRVVIFRISSSDEYKKGPGDHPPLFLMLSDYLVIHHVFEDFGSPFLPIPALSRPEVALLARLTIISSGEGRGRGRFES